MRDRIARKWRPPLLLVLGGALAGVLATGTAGLFAMPLLAPVTGPGAASVIVLTAVLAATALLALLLWRLILRPVTALADRAARLREGDATAQRPLAHYGTQELRDLGDAVLGMAGALQNRAATIRGYTDHVTHELKTPISAIRGAAELLADGDGSAGDRRLAATILDAAARMEALLTALRRMAAAREPMAAGETTLRTLTPRLAADHPGLSVETQGDDIILPLGEEAMAAVLGQFAQNAAQAGAGRLRLIADTGPGGPTLTIGDDGPGITPGNRAHVFEPFFTTRRETNGTGMGLAIAESLLATQGAQITLTDRTPGAWFRIDF